MQNISGWTVDSWKNFPALQQPQWPDTAELDNVVKELSSYPPLVFAGEIRLLESHLEKACRGEAFLLQAGDCAESFLDFSADSIRDKLKVILQMAVVLTYGSGVPVIKVGRIAGQFAKPRSNETEQIGDLLIPSFRGHMVNDETPTLEARRPDPKRLITAYNQSTSTLNLLRAFTKGGFADLSRVHSWNREFVSSSSAGLHYEKIAMDIERALSFMKACGIDLYNEPTIKEVDFFTSHEALILEYEQALTRIDSITGDPYGCSAHMLWIGDRTRQLEGAHLEFVSGIKNPIGIKVGNGVDKNELIKVIEKLNPENKSGRLTLITRFGKNNIDSKLPSLVEAVKKNGANVLWICDPMHGNTYLTENNIKTRDFSDVMSELKSFFEIHKSFGTWPGGIHVELTGDGVTECVGGETETSEENLELRYTSMCDPRLNARQAIDMAFRVAEMLSDQKLS